MPKTGDTRLYKHIRLVLWKKRLQKTGNIWEMRPFWKLAKTATMQRLWPLQSGQFGSKIKIPKKHVKNGCRSTFQLYYAKNGPKKQLIFEKWDHFENWQKWPLCKGYSLCRMVSFGPKLKMPKICDKRLYKPIRLVLWKKRLQKQLIFEKWDHFENWQKWPLCKGYSLCKVVSLGQKLKMPKTCDKTFYKHIRLLLCKKRLLKATNIWEMRPFWKLAKMATMQRL